MVSTTPVGSNISTRKRSRKRYDPVRRREVAKTRELGACTDCRRRKVRCLHAQEPVMRGKLVLAEAVSPSSSPQLNTIAYPTLQNRAARDDESGTHGNLSGGTPPLDSQLWNDGIMPFSDVESYASQNPMIATTKGFAVAASSPPAAPSNAGNMLQHMDEISSRDITQAMHESSYSAALSYPSIRNLVWPAGTWDMAPSFYRYSSQMLSSLHPPPVPGLNVLEADHPLPISVNAYPQDGGQWPTSFECHQPTRFCLTVNFNQTTSPNTFHTGGNSDIIGVGSVLSSGNTVDNSYRDTRA